MIESLLLRVIMVITGIFCIGMGGVIIWTMKDELRTGDRMEKLMAIFMIFLGLIFGLLGVVSISAGGGIV